ncbi:MAG TPA: tryptophan--tRNA ligase [Planctomycetes bacterium]|nr:tryptophan--tRNA ligase [Planctomycetota bacterium]HIN79491.1 tryptophan--tRNA ligase [Planctomycetota bacterium]
MRILSGLSPTNSGVHLGNYFGAVQQWIGLQVQGDAYYFIATYHALTTVRDSDTLAGNAREIALDYLALGLDPTKAVLYRQEDVPEVCELSWVLSTLAPMGLLERCHAYKDKISRGLSADHGLFAYPVLMAADILIVRSTHVPVGQDQKQHVEVTRDLASKFNQTFGEVFPLPEPLIPQGACAKVPGIDGQKMSKSYGNEISIFGDEKSMRKSVMGIVTDSCGVDDPKDPEGNTIFELFKLVASEDRVAEMAEKFRASNQGYGYGHAKQELFEALLDHFGPARAKRESLAADPTTVEDILREGARKVRPVVEETMDAVRRAVGVYHAP